MKTLTISTNKKDEIVDITETVKQEAVGENGLCYLFVKHTTCSLTTADLDPGTDLDFLEALRAVMPKIDFRHPHDPEHTPDHILSSLIGPGVTVPVEDGDLSLGTWQRIVLVELNGPRRRQVNLALLKEAD